MAVETNGHRVLVVDDEPTSSTMALRFQGFAVESAGTGAAALWRWRVSTPT